MYSATFADDDVAVFNCGQIRMTWALNEEERKPALEPGTLATYRSLAVGPVLLGWIKAQVWSGRSRSREKGGCLKVPMLFYHSATIPGRWKARRTKPSGAQVLLVERKVGGSILKGDITSLQPR